MSSTKSEEQYIAILSEKGRATVTGIMHKKLMKFGHVVFELCKWTDRQAYLSQYFAPLWAK